MTSVVLGRYRADILLARRFVSVIGAALMTLGSSVALALDPPRFTAGPTLPRAPTPFLLPELSHPRFDLGLDWTVARLETPIHPGSAVVGIVQPSLEASVLAPRRIFVGVAYPLAVALPPDGGLALGEIGRASGLRTLPGNVEAHVRAVFPLPMMLESGLTIGVVAPTATYDREARSSRSASEAAASLEPTSYVHFLPDRIALRPAGDLRFIRGPFVLQARHGVDIVIDGAGIERVKVAGRLLGHAGYLLRSNLEVSLEASQVYFFSSDEKVSGPPTPENVFAERYRISDARRAAFTVGPAVRLASRDADVGIALVTNVGGPLSPAASSFFGVRLSISAHLARLR